MWTEGQIITTCGSDDLSYRLSYDKWPNLAAPVIFHLLANLNPLSLNSCPCPGASITLSDFL